MNTDSVDFGAAMKPKAQKQKPLVLVKPYDIESLQKKFALYEMELDKMIDRATVLKVRNEETNGEAVAIGTRVRQAWKKIEEAEKTAIAEPDEITKWNNWVKAVKALAKKFKDPLKSIERNLKQKIADYQYRLELDRREEERKAEKERVKLQDQVDKEAKKKGVESVEVAPLVMPKVDKVTRTGTGTSHIRKQWKAFIKDKDKVPREYCEPSQRLLDAAVDQGIRNIEGVEIREVPSTVFRTK